MKKIRQSLILLLFSCIIFSCTTVEKKYASKEKYEVYKGEHKKKPMVLVKVKFHKRKQTRWAEITSPLIPAATFIAQTVHKSDATSDKVELYIERVRFFTNWFNGWTEAEYEASGKIVLVRQEDTYYATLLDAFELWDIKKGEIRYYDRFIRGDQGKRKVKNRIDRLIEVSAYLRRNDFPAHFDSYRKDSGEVRSFVNRIKPFLFPETMGTFAYLKKRGKLEGVDVTGDVISSRDLEVKNGFVWNKTYTGKILPEELRVLRDSGTMWRDFEEAGRLFFTLYNLDYFFNTLLLETEFPCTQMGTD